MNLMWVIYLIDVLTPDAGTYILAVLLGMSLAFLSTARFIAFMDENFDVYLKTKRVHKWMCVVVAILVSYCFFMPSKETSYKMLAAYGVEKVAENPDVRRLAGKSLDVLEKAMDSYIKDSKAKE